MDQPNYSRGSPSHKQFLCDLDLLRRCAVEDATGKLIVFSPGDPYTGALVRLAKAFAQGYQPLEDSLLRRWGIRG